MGNVKFTGIMPALVSPLNEDGSVREPVLRRLVNWHLEAGCSGFYLCGATGEGIVMMPESRKAMAEIVADEVKGKGTVISHIGAADLRIAVNLAKHAADIGIDGISSVPPFFYGYGEKEIEQYYRVLSESSDLPLLIYASPLAGVSFSVEMVSRLLEIKNVIGLKWTSYDYFEMRRIKELNHGDVNVINGPDETLLCGLAMGADGGIGATYNCMPKVFADIYTSMNSGNLERARATQFKANQIIQVLIKYGVIEGIKDTLDWIGFDVGSCTAPMKRFTPLEREAFRAELKAARYEEDYL